MATETFTLTLDQQGNNISVDINDTSLSYVNQATGSYNVSGMYAFGHTPGPPHYGTLAGGTNGTYNHGWYNLIIGPRSYSVAIASRLQEGSGFRTLSYHGANNVLYGWVDHQSFWYWDDGSAQTSIGGNAYYGGSTYVVQINGPGTGAVYSYYFDPNTITGSNTNSPSFTMTDIRMWDGAYPTGASNNYTVGVNGLSAIKWF